jgi:hypothetical protein
MEEEQTYTGNRDHRLWRGDLCRICPGILGTFAPTNQVFAFRILALRFSSSLSPKFIEGTCSNDTFDSNNKNPHKLFSQIAIMAEAGIDRKLDERMEFTTSKDVTVAPTFTDSK